MITAFSVAFVSTGDKTPKYIDRANMDIIVKPGDNFYLYVNGYWIKNNPVPSSKTRWRSFDGLKEESSKKLQSLFIDASARSASSPGWFYANTVFLFKLGPDMAE